MSGTVRDWHLETVLAQAGNRRDPTTGAVSPPIHRSTTFAHPAPGQSTGYDYSRTANPTRTVLEHTIAALEGGAVGLAFSSGMAAIAAVCGLLRPGERVVASEDLYGGTYRLFQAVLGPLGITARYVDTGDTAALASALDDATRAIFLETPTNPTMKVTDVAAVAELARSRGVWTIVDNTFMTPFFQRPLEHGADLVVHSATKYLGGHNDVLAGLVVAREPELGERLRFVQNAVGSVLGPDDAWLVVRGIKTLAVRMERHQANATAVARWLAAHPAVASVAYPGLPGFPRQAVHRAQASGDGGMVAFTLRRAQQVDRFLARLRVITFAESLGGVETLVTHPARQTHADMPADVRQRLGITDGLLRLSVGLEHIDDLLADLAQALSGLE